MENLIKMDDLGVPLFSEISIYIHNWNLKHPLINGWFQLDDFKCLDGKWLFQTKHPLETTVVVWGSRIQ